VHLPWYIKSSPEKTRRKGFVYEFVPVCTRCNLKSLSTESTVEADFFISVHNFESCMLSANLAHIHAHSWFSGPGWRCSSLLLYTNTTESCTIHTVMAAHILFYIIAQIIMTKLIRIRFLIHNSHWTRNRL
jgi:hypothetical protein